jgi:predicted dehydrogenase
MKETLRIGLIGAGMMGVKHSRIYTEMHHACLVGIADIRKNKAQTVAEQCHVKHVVTDYHELLNKDIVYIDSL